MRTRGVHLLFALLAPCVLGACGERVEGVLAAADRPPAERLERRFAPYLPMLRAMDGARLATTEGLDPARLMREGPAPATVRLGDQVVRALGPPIAPQVLAAFRDVLTDPSTYRAEPVSRRHEEAPDHVMIVQVGERLLTVSFYPDSVDVGSGGAFRTVALGLTPRGRDRLAELLPR